MAIRKILIPLIGLPIDKTALKVGLELAVQIGAHVSACFIRGDPQDAVPYLGITNDFRKEIAEEFRHNAEVTGKRAAARSRRQFNSACKKLGVPKRAIATGQPSASASWTEVVGRATHAVPEAAKLCDLTIFTGPLSDYQHAEPGLLESTLLESGRSVLMVPGESFTFPPKNVVVAWDAGIPAVRAAKAALEFVKNPGSIEVLSVEEALEEAADPQRLVEYLGWHGVTSRGRKLEREHAEVGHTLLDTSQDLGASLLVMGGFAHSRFAEIVLGGTTRHVIRNSQIPLLLVH
ncbi:MAG: universal stress protein [Alphaproteobacteria bacterium]